MSTQGKEVVVTWFTPDIEHGDTFYTDSNGLEMQERKLNYRPTWDFSSAMNISSNFYPINSAMAIRDETKLLQMTIMNDRSQAGSVIEKGKFEFLLNRRLYYDDRRGVGEPLNETDAYGNGITVHSSYKLHFFNTFIEASV